METTTGSTSNLSSKRAIRNGYTRSSYTGHRIHKRGQHMRALCHGTTDRETCWRRALDRSCRATVCNVRETQRLNGVRLVDKCPSTRSASDCLFSSSRLNSRSKSVVSAARERISAVRRRSIVNSKTSCGYAAIRRLPAAAPRSHVVLHTCLPYDCPLNRDRKQMAED